MKKRIITISILIAVLLLLIPFPVRLDDGGSVVYKAALYKITDVHRLNLTDGKASFTDGLIIEIFGIEIYNNTAQQKGADR